MQRNANRISALRKQRRQRYEVRYWSQRLEGVPCFILGNGPSIAEQNVGRLDPYFTIGINRAFYLLDTTVLLWQDISLFNTEYHRLHNLQALKLARDTADPRRLYYNFYLKGGGYQFDHDKRTHVLFGRGSSGPLAVQLAVALGCFPIVLLGMDCSRGPQGQSDFYGENPHWLPHTLDYCNKGLLWLKENSPVELINCSDNGIWPKRELTDVLRTIEPKFAQGRQSYVRQLLALSEG